MVGSIVKSVSGREYKVESNWRNIVDDTFKGFGEEVSMDEVFRVDSMWSETYDPKNYKLDNGATIEGMFESFLGIVYVEVNASYSKVRLYTRV